MTRPAKRTLTVWHDRDRDLALWLARSTGLERAAQVATRPLAKTVDVRGFPRLPAEIQEMLYLDKHDIIITLDRSGAQQPVVALEFMTHTPQSQHTKQRFCRLVAAAERGIPVGFVFPERKLSGGQMYTCTADIFYALQRLMDIHGVPCFGYFWPDRLGRIRHSRRHPSAPPEEGDMLRLFHLVRCCVEYALQNRPLTMLTGEGSLRSDLDENRRRGYAVPVQIERYDALSLEPTSRIVRRLAREYGLSERELPDFFLGREYSLIQTHDFRAASSREAVRTDPYAGMQAFFDYCFCRIGPSTRQRQYNLIFRARGVTFRQYADKYQTYWKRRCPFRSGEPPRDVPFLNLHIKSGCRYTKEKALRTYGYLSDMLIFDDFVLYG